MTPLSAHFSLEELIATSHHEIDNAPPAEVVAVLRDTAEHMEFVRGFLGDHVITVSSGYRCPALNAAVGGQPTSAHLTGHAVDFNCYAFGVPLDVAQSLATSPLKFDQIIHEFGRWVHMSFDPRMRGELLTIDSHGTRPTLLPIRP